ncbi:hypothetical protein PCE1_002835 [Barthelona sp. PCE]
MLETLPVVHENKVVLQKFNSNSNSEHFNARLPFNKTTIPGAFSFRCEDILYSSGLELLVIKSNDKIFFTSDINIRGEVTLPYKINDIAVVPNGSVACGLNDGSLCIINKEGIISRTQVLESVSCLAISEDGLHTLVCGKGMIQIRNDMETLFNINVVQHNDLSISNFNSQITACSFISRDVFAVGFIDGTIVVCDIEGKILGKHKWQKKRISCIVSSNTKEYFFTGSIDKSIVKCNMIGEKIKKLLGSPHEILKICVVHKDLISINGERLLHFWNGEAGKMSFSNQGSTQNTHIAVIECNFERTVFITVDPNGSITRWSYESPNFASEPIAEFDFAAPVLSAVIDDNGLYMAVLCSDVLQIVDIEDRTTIFEGHCSLKKLPNTFMSTPFIIWHDETSVSCFDIGSGIFERMYFPAIIESASFSRHILSIRLDDCSIYSVTQKRGTFIKSCTTKATRSNINGLITYLRKTLDMNNELEDLFVTIQDLNFFSTLQTKTDMGVDLEFNREMRERCLRLSEKQMLVDHKHSFEILIEKVKNFTLPEGISEVIIGALQNMPSDVDPAVMELLPVYCDVVVDVLVALESLKDVLSTAEGQLITATKPSRRNTSTTKNIELNTIADRIEESKSLLNRLTPFAFIPLCSTVQESLTTVTKDMVFVNERISMNANLKDIINAFGLSSLRFTCNISVVNSSKYLTGRLKGRDDLVIGEDIVYKLFYVDKQSEDLSDAQFIQKCKMLRRELRVLLRGDPSFVGIEGVRFVLNTEYEDEPFIEYISVELEKAPYDLMRYLATNELSVNDRHHLAVSLIRCIFTIHKMGFIWRDAKPQNVLVWDVNTVKLCDFGTAVNVYQTMNTFGKTMVGTVSFIAPEIISGKSYSFASDIFALGRTLMFIYASDHETLDLERWDDLIDEAPLDLIKRCCSQDVTLRPSIDVMFGWQPEFTKTVVTDRLMLLKAVFTDYRVDSMRIASDRADSGNIVTDEALALTYEQLPGETFTEFFIKVFVDYKRFTALVDDDDAFFGVRFALATNPTEPIGLSSLIDYICENPHMLKLFIEGEVDTTLSYEANMAIVGFLLTCLVFQVNVPSTVVPRSLFVFVSASFDKLHTRSIFKFAWPDMYMNMNNMYSQKAEYLEFLNFNQFGMEDRQVTADNLDEFVGCMMKQVTEQYEGVSNIMHEIFYRHPVIQNLRITLSHKEARSLISCAPRFSTEQLMGHLDCTEIPNDLSTSLRAAIDNMNSDERLRLVFWLTNSQKMVDFRVVLQPDRLMLPSVALCDCLLRLPNTPKIISESLRMAMNGVLPTQFKSAIIDRLSQWTQKEIDNINQELRDAPRAQGKKFPCLRLCPYCFARIYHATGCCSMACTCGKSFCFNCLNPRCTSHSCSRGAAPAQILTLQMIEEARQRLM